MDEFRYGDWLLVIGVSWFGFKFLTAAVSLLFYPRGYAQRAPKDTSSSVLSSERHNAGS